MHTAKTAGLHELAVALHDGVTQELFAAELDIHELRCRTDLPADVCEAIERVQSRLRLGSAQLRSALADALSERPAPVPLVAPALSLVTDAETMLQEFGGRHGIDTALRVGGSGSSIEQHPARVLRRAVQEGLANVGKHAAASRVQLALHRGRRWWSVQLDDDGAGDPAAVRRSAGEVRSFGLSSLDVDVARVGGRLTIAAAPGLGGLRLRVAVPVGYSAGS
ncbi:MAG: sensor histidine kinase [Sporichthyaceae bacterium]